MVKKPVMNVVRLLLLLAMSSFSASSAELTHEDFLFFDFPIPPTISIFRDKIAMMSWGDLEKPKGILITSREMAIQYTKFFKEMWKLAI